jgi:hypothetical protein
MPTRSLTVDGVTWHVSSAGLVTQYEHDEFGLLFSRGSGGGPGEVRVTRYSPQGSRSREQSLAELTDEQLRQLLAASQPSATSPEAGYLA